VETLDASQTLVIAVLAPLLDQNLRLQERGDDLLVQQLPATSRWSSWWYRSPRGSPVRWTRCQRPSSQELPHHRRRRLRAIVRPQELRHTVLQEETKSASTTRPWRWVAFLRRSR